MWGMRDTLRKLRKYYPVPLQVGWVQFFWLYFMIGVEPFGVPNVASLALPLLVGVLTVIILIYRLCKDWKTLRVDDLTSKKVRLFLDKSMQQTFLWALILWMWINSNTLLTSDPIIFIKKVLYIAFSLVGFFVSPLAWNVLLKKLKSKQPASPQQQAMQMLPIEQSK